MDGKLTFTEAKRIPIIEYLQGLGVEPAKINGNDYWYHSPFRRERSPSFKVNAKLNVWYDHGTGEGGTIIDLGAKLHQCSLYEFLQLLAGSNHPSIISPRPQVPVEAPENKLEVLSVRALDDPGLLQYLKHRCISPDLAKQYCSEVEFRIASSGYSAIGFPNVSGGYELRNRWFKGSSSPKTTSHIKGSQDRICVLEGFVDFLSLLQFNETRRFDQSNDSSYLILNSLSFLNKSLPLLKSFREVNLFLDNDEAGIAAKDKLTNEGMVFNDCSSLYSSKKDLNEFLVASRYAETKARVGRHI